MPRAESVLSTLGKLSVNTRQSLILCNRPMYLLGQFVWSTRRKTLTCVQLIWDRLTTLTEAVWSVLCAVQQDVWVLLRISVLFPRYVEWAEGGRTCLSGPSDCLLVNPIHHFHSSHKREWKGDRAFGLKGNVLSHIQQTSTWWMISRSVQQQLHPPPLT